MSDVCSHEEVEVGQDGHQEEGTAKKTVESTTVLRIQIRLLEEKKSIFTLHFILENIVILKDKNGTQRFSHCYF